MGFSELLRKLSHVFLKGRHPTASLTLLKKPDIINKNRNLLEVFRKYLNSSYELI